MSDSGRRPPVGRARLARLGLGSIIALLAGCAGEPASDPAPADAPAIARQAVLTPRLEPLAVPAAAGSFGPELTRGAEGGVILSWLEPLDPVDRHRVRLRWSRLTDQGWGEAREVPVGEKLFANWADRPHVVELGAGGALLAHWLEMAGDGTYTYGIALGHSVDGGASWRPAGWLHDDLSPNEHGFASWVVDGPRLWVVWLDGRAMGEGGPMQLRALALDPAAPGGEGSERQGMVLDERVCECCATDALATPSGPLVAYRDRSADEVRNIAIVRHTVSGWSEPTLLHDDGWAIHGCPVNGPALAAAGEQVAVAWYTQGSDATARVRLAWSSDGGASFGPPIEVATAGGADGSIPLGRLDLELAADGRAWLSWLDQRSPERAEVRLRPVASDGTLGEPVVVAETAPSRASGVPRLARQGDRLVVAWVEASDDPEVPWRARAARLTP